MSSSFDIVILGLTVTSSWGNGHATTWRSLIRGLAARGHRILFLERNAFWYAENRDEPHPEGATTIIYETFDELVKRYECFVQDAAFVIVGSYVPEGIRIGAWVTSIARGKTAFYDIDTPITLAHLETGGAEYITPELIRQYDLYLSFTGGPTLKKIETHYGSPMARALYCSVDPERYRLVSADIRWDLGYLGTYSQDRQPALESFLLEPARRWERGRFAVAGPQYPESIEWPVNVERTIHLSPREHSDFYGAQRFTLNITRDAMKAAGYSPSVRLFEAGACATPVISDWWEGLDTIFRVGEEVLVVEDSEQILRYLRDLPEAKRLAIAGAARERALTEHTHAVRAEQLETYLKELNDDHHPPGATRRYERGGNVAGRSETRLALERQGPGTGEPSSSIAFPVTNRSDIHEPTRTSR